jgi:hypothetical protein
MTSFEEISLLLIDIKILIPQRFYKIINSVIGENINIKMDKEFDEG